MTELFRFFLEEFEDTKKSFRNKLTFSKWHEKMPPKLQLNTVCRARPWLCKMLIIEFAKKARGINNLP